jgi:hypothetical protein
MTVIVATIGIAALFGLMIYVEERGDRIRRWFRMPDQSGKALQGYDNEELVDVVFRKTVAYEPQGDWPEIASASTVLDFGGGCGLHYKEARSPTVRWAVVETPAMVAKAKELSTNNLQFFSDVEAAASWLGSVDVMHSNGALQYASDPIDMLHRLCAVRAKTMLWKRAVLSKNNDVKQEVQSSRLADNGPGRLLAAPLRNIEYVRTAIPEQSFLSAHADYRLVERGGDWFHFELKETYPAPKDL